MQRYNDPNTLPTQQRGLSSSLGSWAVPFFPSTISSFHQFDSGWFMFHQSIVLCSRPLLVSLRVFLWIVFSRFTSGLHFVVTILRLWSWSPVLNIDKEACSPTSCSILFICFASRCKRVIRKTFPSCPVCTWPNCLLLILTDNSHLRYCLSPLMVIDQMAAHVQTVLESRAVCTSVVFHVLLYLLCYDWFALFNNEVDGYSFQYGAVSVPSMQS